MTMRAYLLLIIVILLAALSCWQEIGGIVNCYPDSAGNCYLTRF